MTSNDSKGPVRWVAKTAFVMPVLHDSLGIDPLLSGLLHCMSFLELSGDEDRDPDWAVEAMEHVALYLQRVTASDHARIAEQLTRIVQWSEARGEPQAFTSFVRDFLSNAGVGVDQGNEGPE